MGRQSLPYLLCLLALLSTTLHAKVEISGLDKAQEKNVRAWLSIVRLPEDVDPTTLGRRHRLAEQEIGKALQALGYYTPTIHNSELISEHDSWVARYHVDAGARCHITSLELKFSGPGGTHLHGLIRAPEWIGQPLDHVAYGKFKDNALNIALGAGYLDAHWAVSRLLIDPSEASARVELELESGVQYRFGQIEIKQDILDPAFIGRYVRIRPTETFSAEKLLRLQLTLTDLDYFKGLDVETKRDAEAGRLDVNIVAEAKAQQRYQFGAGYGTDTGARFSISNEFRWLNQQGHRLRNDLRVAQHQNSVSSQYLIPAGHRVGSNWSLQARYLEEQFASAQSEEYKFGLTRSHGSGPRLWQYYLNYGRQIFRVGNDRQRSELLTPGISLTLRESDDSLNPRMGYKLFADVHGAHQDLAASDSFIQSQIQGRMVYPSSGRSRLLLRAQLGASFVGPISDLPLSQRFFAGGDQSIRGYAYQSLGPKNAEGDVIGGKYLGVYSVEFERLFVGSYGAAIFFDYGGASERLGDADYRGVGLGFRWRSTIGMVRADLAHPLDDPDGGVRIHIGIGAEL